MTSSGKSTGSLEGTSGGGGWCFKAPELLPTSSSCEESSGSGPRPHHHNVSDDGHEGTEEEDTTPIALVVSSQDKALESPTVDIYTKRPSYFDIEPEHRILPPFDTAAIKKFEFSEEEDEDERSEQVKTFLRIRPYVKTTEDEVEMLTIKNETSVIANHFIPSAKGTKGGKKIEFQFSKVLDGSTSQENVFEQVVAPLLDRFHFGDSSLIFSYGATNSGKTFTMRGSSTKYGIIPRTLYRIFDMYQHRIYTEKNCFIQPFQQESTRALQGNELKAILRQKEVLINSASGTQEMKSRGKLSETRSSHCGSVQYVGLGVPPGAAHHNNTSFRHTDSFCVGGRGGGSVPSYFGFWVSFVEVYNEKCHDLFASGKRKEVKLVSERGGSAYFKDLTEIPVFYEEEAFALYVAGYRKLEVASTNVNSTSSRSHCFFTIRAVELGRRQGIVFPMKVHRLTFCDLAGCERVNQTENSGGLLRESNNINQSLMSLLKVIRMIREHQSKGSQFLEKIPFRESKLTRIFQGYFTASTHISMIVNVNPAPKMFDSTITTLYNSAVCSAIVAFRPRPATQIMVNDPRANTSYLHSSRDLEDVLEETEDEEEDDINECLQNNLLEEKENKGMKIKMQLAVKGKNDTCVLKEPNYNHKQGQDKPGNVLGQFKVPTVPVKKEKCQNFGGGEGKAVANVSNNALILENQQLRKEKQQLLDTIADLHTAVGLRDLTITSLQNKVGSIEAETKELLLAEMFKLQAEEVRSVERRNLMRPIIQPKRNVGTQTQEDDF